jgi:hypothetical protein
MKKIVIGLGLMMIVVAGCSTLEQLFGKPCLTEQDCPGDAGVEYEPEEQEQPSIPPFVP